MLVVDILPSGETRATRAAGAHGYISGSVGPVGRVVFIGGRGDFPHHCLMTSLALVVD